MVLFILCGHDSVRKERGVHATLTFMRSHVMRPWIVLQRSTLAEEMLGPF
jgi:hypothetical protein